MVVEKLRRLHQQKHHNVRSRNYLLSLEAVPIDKAQDFTRENGLSSIETPTLNCTNLELLCRQSLFLRDKRTM